MTQPQNYQRALFIRFGGMGDILLATPSVRAVAAAFPGIAIDFLVGEGNADAVTGHPCVRQVLTFDKHGADARLKNFLPFLGRIAQARYDLVVNLHPSARTYLIAAVSGAGKQLTFRKRMGLRPDTGRIAHAVDDFLKDLAPLGIPLPQDRSLDFIVPPPATQKVAELLHDAGITDGDRLLVINPEASRRLNRWPVERFAEVAAHWARQPGVRVAVTGTNMSSAHPSSVTAADPRILDLNGKLTMKELGALLMRADTLLTCDTGPMHIGAAVGAPLVVLSGAADPDRTGPLTENSTVLIDRTLSCVPCRDRICARGDVMCMQNLSVPAVLSAIALRISRPERKVRGIALPVLV